MKFTTFQKINFLLITYLIVCFIIELIALAIDIYQYLQIEDIKTQAEYIWKSIEWASIFIVGLFLIVIPNVFSIVVHDLKSSLVPPINKWSIFVKNLPLYFLIFITLAALFTLAFF
jgi:LEA14-like dessication related protein